jgi:Zn-finger nucleic acid-binding protein
VNEGPYRGAAAVDPDEPPVDPNRPWLLQTWTSRRECPQCNVALFAARKEGYRIDACATCGGAWMDHELTARAVADADLTPAQLSDHAAKHAGRVPATKGRACPICNGALKEKLVPEARVVIDVCEAHGAWFDADEMRTVIEALVRAHPPPLDPSVDEAIRREAFMGQFRPPENYEPGYVSGPSLWDVVSILFGSRK